jgi:arylamine N-acetyltransferase
MMQRGISTATFTRYLRILGVDRRAPSLEALTELTRAHLTGVPFENVSKLYRYRRSGLRGIPDVSEYLDDIERNHLGGTCYTNNYFLYLLLDALGYEVALCGADMSNPDVHLASIVKLDGREYIVDAGYGAPFLAPIPRDLERDHEVLLGSERYVLRPRDAEGRSRLEQHRDGKPSHGYTLKPAPRRIEEFAGVIENSFAPAATFMNALAVVRFWPGRSLALHNQTLIESEGLRARKERIASPADLPRVIEERFSIPQAITRVAMEGLRLTEDPWDSGSAEEDRS